MLGLVVVLLLIVGVFSYKFTVGEVEKSEDDRDALLTEMRTWLETTQAIIQAASEDNCCY